MRKVDLIGQRFGLLICLERIVEKGRTKYVCYCKCGNETVADHCHLVSGRTKSCGCLRRGVTSKRARKAPGHSVRTNVWNYYRRNAQQRGLEWHLTREQFVELIDRPCTYCGRSRVTTTSTTYGDVLQHNGVDRTDNALGYTPENSVACCKTCNLAKNNLSLDEFRAWARALALKLGGW